MGKSALIMVLGTFTIFGIINLSVNDQLNQTTEEAADYYEQNFIRNSCNSMVEMIMANLDPNEESDIVNASFNFYDCNLTYSVTDTTIENNDYKKIEVSGTYEGESHQVEAIVSFPTSGGGFPPAVKGAITTNNPVELKGNLEVDGRDHDKNGVLVDNSGTYGIWTTSTLDRKGAATIGGTNNGTDFEPEKTSDTSIAAVNQMYPGGYPNSPDSVLGGAANGYPEGTLKSIAQSGDDGSQYVTDPTNLTYPLKGVTYVELEEGETWNPADITGSGILVVHNSTLDAKIKNINWAGKMFKGFLIADDIIHIHADILGAVIGLTPNPSEGNCIGNGHGRVKYSSEVISEYMPPPSGGGGGGEGGTPTDGRVVVYSWYE